MTTEKFNLFNKIAACAVTVTAAVTYFLTLEPSAPFWDCGEFIASSYKLEVGHPPGNPVFQLFARIFTIPFSGENVAVAVNALSGLCSAFTIFFLYLTIVFFAKRMVSAKDNGYNLTQAIAIIGSGIVGALAYTFSDTFWFSAVEGEVYGMSSLFTAAVLWLMTKWYEQSDTPYANRWILLISFLMGLSIGVHLLNLLMIPAIVFLYFFRKRENSRYTLLQCTGILLLGAALVGFLTFIFIPLLPKMAAWFDLFFVNTLGLPFNTGAIFFMAALFVTGFFFAFNTYRKGKVFANSAIVCTLALLIGYSMFSICVIRSAAKTPTNEYQPDNPFTLVRYLGREQYGSVPLLYGPYFGASMTAEPTKYWTPLGDKYVKADGQPDIKYDATGKMFFPRMYSSSEEHVKLYKSYMDLSKGKADRKPTFAENLAFFFDFQMNWMYWRYFMWNFAGRQNDIHSPAPGDIFFGNWECGIPAIDRFRLGDQSEAPVYLKDNKGKNHYYMLPLLLGLIGLFFQFRKDGRGAWITFLVFFMTGIAIVLYLNQPPYQVRERDYAYAGSFYAFCFWIGFSVLAIVEAIGKIRVLRNEKARTALSASAVLLCLGVPVLMAEENWDDHDRSNRRTAAEIAYNYLNSVGPDGILVTHGDNDTFPLWYAQEVEGVRTDVRICNTSLLGTDWHIDQMKYACNESAPLPISVPAKQYLYGTNEYVYIVDNREQVIPISDVMRVFKHPDAKIQLSSGARVDYIVSRRISIPVNKENVLKYGILDKKFEDMIPSEIIITIPKAKDYITKPELFVLDLLSGYNWDRPLNFLSMGGDINIGIKEYLMYTGFSYKLVPLKTGCRRSAPGLADVDELYKAVTSAYKFDAISRDDYFADYQNVYTFCGVMNYREVFNNVADLLVKAGRKEEAVALLDKAQDVVKSSQFPLDLTLMRLGNEMVVCNMIDTYYRAGNTDKARKLASEFAASLLCSADFLSGFYNVAKSDMETVVTYLYYLIDNVVKANGDATMASQLETAVNGVLQYAR